MKTAFAVFFLITSLLLGSLCFMQWRTKSNNEQQVATLEEKVQKLEQQVATDKQTVNKLKQQRSDLNWEIDNLHMQVRAISTATNAVASSTPAAQDPQKPANDAKGGGSFLANMMKDPEMRKVIEQQQAMMMDMMYAPMYKELGLSKEEQEAFKKMMLDRATSAMERAGSIFGETDGTETKEDFMAKLGEEHKASEQTLKDFLGEDRYAKYKNYNETIGERMVLNQFTAMNSVPEEQSAQLLNIMREEKRNYLAEIGEDGGDREIREMRALASEEAMNNLFERQEKINARIAERAKGVLPEDKLDAFTSFQANQLNMQKMGLNMARKMFGGDKTAPPPPPQPVPER